MVTGASLTAEELCAASGLSEAELAGLQGFGLIEPVIVAGIPTFDEDALTVANLAAEFRKFGIEARHLRLYRNAVDREIGLIEQVIIPLLRQRNPESRQRATEPPTSWGPWVRPCGPPCCDRLCGATSGADRIGAFGRYISFMVRVLLRAVRVDLQTNTPVLLLQETDGEGRTLPIFIGNPEATAIAYALQGVTMPRPLTHDLMKDMLGALEISVEQVIITELRSSTYFAELHLRRGEERTVVSSRPVRRGGGGGANRDPDLRGRRADGVRRHHLGPRERR